MNMMIKKWTAVIAGLTLVLIIAYSVKNTFAQSFFNPNANKPAADQTTSPAQQTMEPNEFRSTVNSLGQHNLNNLSEQVNKQLPKPSPLVKSILAPGEMSKPPAEAATPPATPAPPPVTTIPPAAAASSTPPPASPPPLAAPAPTPAAPPASPPVQNQEVYTGFGAGSSTTGTTGKPASNTSKDSGWNVNY